MPKMAEGVPAREFPAAGHGYKACYIALESGRIIFGSGHAYTAPRGYLAFAMEWKLVTRESKPRRIPACPW